MVKAGDYRQASGQSGIGGRGSTWRSLFGWHRHRRGAVRSRRCLMRLCWKPVSRRLSLTWSFCSRDIHLPPIWRAGGEGCFIICFASLDVFRHQAKGNNQAYVVFESNKHNISCYCILMWFFIDPCRKTLVFLALQTRARRLEVSCLLGLWFVKTSQLEADRPPRPARKPPSCPDFPVHRVFTLLRGGSKKSQSLHTCKSLTQRGVCTFKMTTTEQHFFSGLQKGGSQSVALLRLPRSCQCEGCQQALLSTRPQTIYRIKMVPSAFNTSAWACCSCCKCVWAFPASTVTSAPPCVSCSSWK